MAAAKARHSSPEGGTAGAVVQTHARHSEITQYLGSGGCYGIPFAIDGRHMGSGRAVGAQQESEIVVFRLATSAYALPLSQVVELLRVVAPTPLPGSSTLIEGVVSVRGKLLPLLDIRARFGLPPKPLSPDDHLIVARRRDRDVLLRVDRVDRIATVDSSDVQTIEEIRARTEYVAGVLNLPDGIVLIHDLDTFLSESEAAELSSAVGELKGARE